MGYILIYISPDVSRKMLWSIFPKLLGDFWVLGHTGIDGLK